MVNGKNFYHMNHRCPSETEEEEEEVFSLLLRAVGLEGSQVSRGFQNLSSGDYSSPRRRAWLLQPLSLDSLGRQTVLCRGLVPALVDEEHRYFPNLSLVL